MFNADIVNDIDVDAIAEPLINAENESGALDEDVTQLKVQDAIKALNNYKAAGPDGLSGEFFKYSAPRVVSFLTKYFNKLFESSVFPIGWSESLIQPLHKKADKICPDNDRGISPLNVSGKLYIYILIKRLTEWVQEHRLINEAKACFRRNCSTIDQIFTLLTAVQKQLRSRGKLSVAFIDLKKQ